MDRLDTGTRLAYKRTFQACERTQMAWVRTSLAMISFGFGIAKFFEHLREQPGPTVQVLGPFTVGMLMIIIGIVSLALANVQHRQALQSLRKECPDLPLSVAGATAVLTMMLGAVAVVSTLLRH